MFGDQTASFDLLVQFDFDLDVSLDWLTFPSQVARVSTALLNLCFFCPSICPSVDPEFVSRLRGFGGERYRREMIGCIVCGWGKNRLVASAIVADTSRLPEARVRVLVSVNTLREPLIYPRRLLTPYLN